MKALLALTVISIHTVLWTKNRYIGFIAIPITRLAVPIFFLFSGYFFFKRIRALSKADQPSLLKRSIIRYLQLYLFWFVVTFPVTYATMRYFANGFWFGLKRLFLDGFLFGSTFFASWYIMGVILGIPIVYFASRIMSNKVMLVIAWVINSFAVILTNYGLSPLGQAALNWLHSWPISISPSLSFMVGLLWIVIGKMFADGDLDKLINPRGIYWAMGAMLLLYGEELLVHRIHTMYYNDCYFMLLPVCMLFFGWLLTTHVNVPYAREMRAFSTIAYCFHGSLVLVIKYVLQVAGSPITRIYESLLLWAFVVVVSWILTLVILRLQHVRHLGWIRLSH